MGKSRSTGLVKRSLDLLGLGRQASKLKAADSSTVAANARLALIERMGRLRGLPQKIGQILSMSADEGADDFKALTNNAEPLPIDIIRAELADAWSSSPEKVLEWLDPEGLAASLGQVHRARLKDGTEVAVKVRYPDIDAAVSNDLRFLGWLSIPVGGLRRGFDLADYRQEILRDLTEELDYRAEADNQREFAKISSRLPFLVVPEVVDRYSGEKVLVSRWEEGEEIDVVARTWSESEKRKLGKALLKCFCETLFGSGRIHADPHAGNYRFRRTGTEPSILLYDYGSVARIDEVHRLALARLILAAMSDAAEDPFPLFLILGFDSKTLEPLRPKLPALCRVLFEPFCADAPYPLDQWNRGERVSDILGEDRWNFRISGPATMLLLMRAFGGLVYYLEKLGEPVNWTWHCRPILERYAEAAGRLELPVPPDPQVTFRSLARYLQIHVTERGRTKVKVTLPAIAVEDLNEYLDDDIRQKIGERGIEIKSLVKEVRRSGYAPRELLDLEESPRRFRVWLE